MSSPAATATAHALPLGGAPSLFSMMAPNIMASMSVPTVPTIPPPAAAVPAPLPVNQPLPFTPGLRPEEFGTMIATTIADKLGAMLNGNRQYPPHDRPLPMGSCNFCGQATHYIRSCEVLNWYVADNRCRKDMQGRMVNNDGTIIH